MYHSIGDRVWPDRQYYPNGSASLMNLIEAIIAVSDGKNGIQSKNLKGTKLM